MAELHIVGSIDSGHGFAEAAGLSDLFLKWTLESGPNFRVVQGLSTGQTHCDHPDDAEAAVWSHPLDVHYTLKGIDGWPRISLEVWGVDRFGRNELAGYGEIEELNVCENLGDHMVGNVYCEFADEEHSDAALKALFGRFYAGRPLVCEFSPVTDFREARCRQYDEAVCTRGGYCHFMHLRTPSRSFRQDLEKPYQKKWRNAREKRARQGRADSAPSRGHFRASFSLKRESACHRSRLTSYQPQTSPAYSDAVERSRASLSGRNWPQALAA